MEGAPLSLIIDVVVLVLLGLTIVYAARLSLQLGRLRDSKSELDKVVRDLVKNIDRADRAIAGLKEAARDSGTQLQDAVDKAMAISDELQLITESGDRLAARLETMMDDARPLAGPRQTTGGGTTSAPAQSAQPPVQEQQKPKTAAPEATYAQHLRKLDAGDKTLEKTGEEGGGPKFGFAIRDPDAERGIDPLAAGPEDDASGQGLYSEAERDLFRAMKGRVGR